MWFSRTWGALQAPICCCRLRCRGNPVMSSTLIARDSLNLTWSPEAGQGPSCSRRCCPFSGVYCTKMAA